MSRRNVVGKSKRIPRRFHWLRNYSDFLVGSLRTARKFDAEDYIAQLAEYGFTHVTVNGLGAGRPFETGPAGDVYSWFYDYSPDLDQFVESTLLKGFYPTDYLNSNLAFLKRIAAFSIRYRLIPGLHINSPRSMPEAFWRQYPYLRGARVDHPRESFLPRYTLAMAHPVVRQHYRELVANIMREVPQIGFIHVWTNDSGAGFEFTSSLYAGRNGGPYLIREWKSDKEIERKASENVLAYYKLLRDEARRLNPEFRLVCDLGPFYKERPHIIRQLGGGIDAGSFAYFEGPRYKNEKKELQKVGAWIHQKIDISDNNILGVPCPRFTYERLMNAARRRANCILTSITPRTHAPFDVNSEVLRAVQLGQNKSLDDILHNVAVAWVGERHAKELISVWGFSDSAVRSYPSGVPHSTYGFPWFRLWVRPFAPNIEAISEQERSYYEEYLLATFNNPARVDLNNDMMWNFLTVVQAEKRRMTIDNKVIASLRKGIAKISTILDENDLPNGAKTVFKDIEARFIAARCYYTTMRNLVAWIESVHGYMQATTTKRKLAYRSKVREMVANEIQNAKDLLHLWRTDAIEFTPVSRSGETLHIYGENFGELLKKKVELMEKHKNDEPYINPNYMWRMPSQFKETITG